METKYVAGIITMVAFVSALVGGALIPANTQIYHCADTDFICIGVRLSSTNKTCYYMDDLTERGKRCTSLWEPWVDNVTKTKTMEGVKIKINGQEWSCPTMNGFIEKCTVCISGDSEKYLCDLI